MALNDKKSGFKLEDRLPKAKQYESTDTDTETYTRAYARNPNRKERKKERLQLSVTPSTKERFAQYAADNDTSMNELVQCLIDRFLEESGY